MIKFFRKIRYDLIENHKTGKYFKYAIGEIVLVVIGILIALQINNWNENRKNKITEADYYCRILDDFLINEKLIDETIEITSYKVDVCKQIIVDLNTFPNNKSKILNNFLIGIRQNVFVPSMVAFKDLSSSGNLHLLKDIELKNRLIEHSTYLDNTLNLLAENRNENIKRLGNLESVTAFGFQEFDYLEAELGKEIISFLPSTNWTNEPKNPEFLKFQDNLIYNITMFLRQIQHLSALKIELQEPLKLLKDKKCT